MPRLLLAGLAVLGLGVSGCGSQDETSSPNSSETAVIRVEGFGDIEIRFFPDEANGHVENFKKLARAKFYDGTTFHRVIPGFMIQGGDPLSRDDNPLNDGTGGPDYTIVAEFNDVPHRRGIVSMARGNDPDSAGSQFFIIHQDSAAWPKILDGKYTAFGEVVSGIEIVDEIAEVERDRRDRPLRDVVMKSVRLQR